jgi:hypothetical protein
VLEEGEARPLPTSVAGKSKNPFEYARREKPAEYVIQKTADVSVEE